MAFIKLFPYQGAQYLDSHDIIERLRDEFKYVDVDTERGRDHVAGMIAATRRFSEAMPGKQDRIAALQAAQDYAVYVCFGDDPSVSAACCIMPESELFFGSPDEVDGDARPLVERCAGALNYEVFPG